MLYTHYNYCALETVVSFYLAENKPMEEDTEHTKLQDKMNPLKQVQTVLSEHVS